MLLQVLTAAGVFLGACIAASAQDAPPEKPVAYVGATVIDTDSGAVRRGMTIVVSGERIVSVDRRGPPPAGAAIVDVHGLYAIPGLIETHVHYGMYPDRKAGAALLRRDVYSGITAVRDMAGDARVLAEMAREARFGEIPAPDVFYAALMAGPEFFSDDRVQDSTRGMPPGMAPWMRAIDAQTDLKLAVANAAGTGATGIKIYADLPSPLVQAIAAEAHKQGLRVWAHAAVFPASPAEVVAAGVDVVSHSCLLAYQASAEMPRAYHNRAPVDAARFAREIDPSVTRLFAQMKARGTILDATNYVYEVIDKANAEHPGSRPTYCSAEIAERITAAAYRAGVDVSLGTDAPAPWQDPYPALFDEAELMARSGILPTKILRSATIVGARVIGQSHEMGTIESGKLANIVFLARNPQSDIRALRSTVMTIKRGTAYRRADYVPIRKEEMGSDE